MHSKFVIEVPASSGNLGCGFDILSAAVDIVNTFEIEIKPGKFSLNITPSGENADIVERGKNNIFWKAALVVFKKVKFDYRKLERINVKINIKTPLMRGLGSSGTAHLAGAFFANEVSGRKLGKLEILKICAHLEGHYDNVASSLYGGIVLTVVLKDRVNVYPIRGKFNYPLTIAIPEIIVNTKSSRGSLPEVYSKRDVIFNLSRVASLMYGILEKGLESFMFEDRIHTPYRKKFIKGFDEMKKMVEKAGAKGFFISGSGSSVVAVAKNKKDAKTFKEMFEKFFKKLKIPCRVIITKVRDKGVVIKHA